MQQKKQKFISNLAAESQVWLKFAFLCEYLDVETGRQLYSQYNQILGLIVTMINSADKWLLKND